MSSAGNAWIRASAGAVLSGALVCTGLTACGPAPAALKCTASASPTSPVAGGNATVTIKTVAGAKAVTTANSTPKIKATNALGLAEIVYPVANATVGHRVNVTVRVTKGAQTGNCTTSFTPVASTTTKPPVGTPAPGPAPLAATITPGWKNVVVGASIVGSPGSCQAFKPGTGGGCGTFTASALITGFAAYGGIPACTDPSGCFSQKGPQLSGTATLSWSLVCSATGQTTNDSQQVALTPAYPGYNALVTSFTRVNNDSAQVGIAVDMPFQADVNLCAGSSTLTSVSASSVALHLPSGGTFPAGDFASAGPFTP